MKKRTVLWMMMWLLVVTLQSVFGQNVAKKPTITILPSDNWCAARYFMTTYDNQGTEVKIPDYQTAFQQDSELPMVIANVGTLLTDYGYSIKDAEQELKAMGCKVDVCTMDGSYGTKGVVTDLLDVHEPFYYACGPLPMLKALVKKIGMKGQVSMEDRMGCGVGICVGCSIETKNGIKRVCKEGPVFDAEELIW